MSKKRGKKWLLIGAAHVAEGTQIILTCLFGRQLEGSAAMPQLGSRNFVPLTRRWGTNVSAKERAAIEAEDCTAEMITSGEIVEGGEVGGTRESTRKPEP